MDKSPAELFIEERGGAHQLARALDVKPVNVRMWKMRKSIPRSAWPEIIDAFPGVTMDELRAIETASRPQDKAA